MIKTTAVVPGVMPSQFPLVNLFLSKTLRYSKQDCPNAGAGAAMSSSMQAMSSSLPSLSALQDTQPGNPLGRKLLASATNPSQRQLLQNPSNTIPDTRTVVPDTSVVPFNSIGLIQIYGEDGSLTGICSGALIKASVILTAGHCIWDTKTNAFIGSADFTPGYNPAADPPAPYGTVNGVKMMVPTLFTECTDASDGNYGPCHQAVDFGLMLIDEEYTEWMGYGYGVA